MNMDDLDAPAYGAVPKTPGQTGLLERSVDTFEESGERPSRIMRADKILVVEALSSAPGLQRDGECGLR